MSQFRKMSNEYLIKTYVPDVYQKSIFNIDYDQLKKAGVNVISFDIDDTIVPIEQGKPSKNAVTLFEKLKQMGFELYLVSNANYERVKLFSKRLEVEGVPRAKKPYTKSLKMIQKLYSEKFGIILLPTEMAHVGNSMAKDVATGNSFGIITCLVRDAGNLPHIGRMLNPKKTDGQIIRDVLLERGIWRKHHYKSKDDQYYQLNEKQISFVD